MIFVIAARFTRKLDTDQRIGLNKTTLVIDGKGGLYGKLEL
jgi:hypothetical protein